MSDREMARSLIASKRERAVKFSDSTQDLVSMPPADSPSLGAKELRSNLMRVQTDRDPLFYYEVIKVVGVGSMGSVAMVRKKDEVVGGSARSNLVDSFRRQKKMDDCFKIPIVGGIFRYCMEASEEARPPLVSQVSTASGYDSTRSSKASVLYALKSIHLNRMTDQVYIEELKNEIEILKCLVRAHDHPQQQFVIQLAHICKFVSTI
jgi:serine/threonine protein kinase